MVHRVWQEIIIEGKLDLANELVDPAYVYHGPGGYEAKGPERFKRLISATRINMADLNVSNVGVNDLIAEKDTVLS